MNNAISTTHLMNRASPQCWMESITTISQWGSVSGASYCASMTTEQQKVLALELTNCQLMEENRALFVQDDDSMQVSKYASCHVGEGGSEPYEVLSCLRFMTDFALNLYHQMLLYANDVCNRLTNDMMEQQKEETTLMLIKASSAFVDLTRQQQMEADLAQQALLEAISRNKVYLEEHQQQWEEANQARQTELARAQEARERAAEAREREVEAREKAALLAMQEMVETNTMHFQEQQQKWEELNSARDKEMHVVEERREQTEAIIKKQQYDMERMQEVIANTNSQMQPLSSMHLYVKMVTSGFTVLKSILIFFLSMNVSWMLTTIPLLSRARRSLYVIFFIGFVLELAVVCLAEDTSLADGGVNVAQLIRIYTRVSAFIACVIAFLMACICTKKDATADITMDELLKRQMEVVAMLGATQQMDSYDSTPTITQQRPLALHGTTVQPRYKGNKEEANGDSFIISNPNFKPSRRQRKSSHYQPYHRPLRACESPVLASKKSTASEPANRMANTVTPNARFPSQHECEEDRTIIPRQEMQHIQQLQSNAESSSDSSDDSSGDDEPAQLVMTKKKRKHAELQMIESEQGDSSHKHQSKVNETKKKKSKLEEIKIY